jgi:hypothetical protein
MRKLLLILVLITVASTGWIRPVAAQEDDERVDSAFSDQVIRTLGYPEVAITVGPDGIVAPATLEAEPVLITLTTPEPYIAYLDIVQAPAGLSEEELLELAEAAGTNDLPQSDWVYAGGTNTPGPGEPASFIIDLRPGDYQIVASYYTDDPNQEEIYGLSPLTVNQASAEATPGAVEPASTVTLEMTDDLQYIVTPDSVPAGPQVWKITNTGQMHAHHVVMVRVPDGTTAQDIIGEFNSMVAGTPPAGDAVFNQVIWVGYAALQSGGTSTWAEFDLEPATYAVICFIINPETGRPHAADGMVTVFTVE